MALFAGRLHAQIFDLQDALDDALVEIANLEHARLEAVTAGIGEGVAIAAKHEDEMAHVREIYRAAMQELKNAHELALAGIRGRVEELEKQAHDWHKTVHGHDWAVHHKINAHGVEYVVWAASCCPSELTLPQGVQP